MGGDAKSTLKDGSSDCPSQKNAPISTAAAGVGPEVFNSDLNNSRPCPGSRGSVKFFSRDPSVLVAVWKANLYVQETHWSGSQK